jgi:capsular polysaccharide export protein
MAPAIEGIIHSFARNAPLDALLVITEHPLDNGVVDLQDATLQAAAAAGVTDRLVFIRGGSPNELLQKCRGLVTVNSTTAIVAMNFGIPVVALGEAIYNLPGLTFQGDLNRFWLEATMADPTLFEIFRRVVTARTQINGSFYSTRGRRLAVQSALARFEALATSQTQNEHESSIADFVRNTASYSARTSAAAGIQSI